MVDWVTALKLAVVVWIAFVLATSLAGWQAGGGVVWVERERSSRSRGGYAK